MKTLFSFILFSILLNTSNLYSQEENTLSLSEYLGYVKQHHPVVKQANLTLNQSEAKLLKARGAFNPKIEVDYSNKEFKNKNYYDKLNTTFKIPTWYGIELKGNFQDNSGIFLNPEYNVPENGLYGVGISIPIAKGLLMNERMATLKQAKLYIKQAQADNQIVVNQILHDAINAYLFWVKSYKEQNLYRDFIENSKFRLEGVIKSVKLGEKAAIDSIEAKIAYNNRLLSLEKATLTYTKASLSVSNYLWLNNIPIELAVSTIPDLAVVNQIDEALNINTTDISDQMIKEHPKLKSLDFKLNSLNIERRLQRNNLLPTINLEYNLLSPSIQTINSFDVANYKTGVLVSFPIFLSKERAKFKLATYKVQDAELEIASTKLTLKNKLDGIRTAINSYTKQISITTTIVNDYKKLLDGELQKFNYGESSLFLVNYREVKLIDSQLKAIETENKLLQSKNKWFNTIGRTIQN